MKSALIVLTVIHSLLDSSYFLYMVGQFNLFSTSNGLNFMCWTFEGAYYVPFPVVFYIGFMHIR